MAGIQDFSPSECYLEAVIRALMRCSMGLRLIPALPAVVKPAGDSRLRLNLDEILSLRRQQLALVSGGVEWL